MIRKEILPIKVKDVKSDYIGDGEFIITEVSSLKNCSEKSLAFYKGDDVAYLRNVSCGALIIKSELKEQIIEGTFNSLALFFDEYPAEFFTKFTNERFDNDFLDKKHTDEDALISKFAYVEEGVTFGKNCKIFPNATIYRDTTFGDNCSVQSNTVVGGIGMSYIKSKNGDYTRLTHLGNVEIGDNVEIGCNTTVLRGILEPTVIKSGVKIGNQVNIGHSSIIGENCYISAGAVVGGATIVGDNCWIAPGVSLRDNIKIGENCTIGVGSTVVKNTEPNSVYYGSPAKFVKNK
jgi:UDP-3-O-[3-hydroxymyristoyl] glucosamine N-acyltransferase